MLASVAIAAFGGPQHEKQSALPAGWEETHRRNSLGQRADTAAQSQTIGSTSVECALCLPCCPPHSSDMHAHMLSSLQAAGTAQPQRRWIAQRHFKAAAAAPRPAPSARRAVAVALRPLAAAAAAGPAVTLILPDSSSLPMPQAVLVIGSTADADLQLQGSNIAAQHARLEHKGGRLFCTALGGDPDLLLASTHCWLDGVELRAGVRCRGMHPCTLTDRQPDSARQKS